MPAQVLRNIQWSSRLLFQPPESLNMSLDPSSQDINSSSSFTTSISSSSQVNNYSDKIDLPTSVLQALLDQSTDETPLPSPLTFKLTNPANGLVTHVGIRQFSAEEGSANIPSIITSRLKLEAGQAVIAQFVELPKGSSLQLRPLEGGSDIEDWKALLEAKLNSTYTALTKGDILKISNPLDPTNPIQLIVEDVKPADAVCIVDTDLDLEINQGAQADGSVASVGPNSVQRASTPVSNQPSEIKLDHPLELRNISSQPLKFILSEWNHARDLVISIDLKDSEDVTNQGLVNVYASLSEFAVGPQAFLWTALAPSQIVIKSTDPYLQDLVHKQDKRLYIVVDGDVTFKVGVTQQDVDIQDVDMQTEVDSTTKRCPNCHQYISSGSIDLHLAFCERNNLLCPDGCGRIFRKREGIPVSHWHCSLCTDTVVWGDSESSKEFHQRLTHEPQHCDCGKDFHNLIALGQHKALDCPLKLHICQFCHLKLPQEEASATDIMEGYTGHESRCGSRTTNCHICNRVVRLRDMKSHLQYHNLQRVSASTPVLCSNANCSHVVNHSTSAQLGLCSSCFGPLHSTIHDPTLSKLRMRIERRYVIQLTRGCGKPWCTNVYCATGNVVKRTMAESMAKVKNLMELAAENKFNFCVDEMTTKRRMFVDYVSSEGVYDTAWCAKAIEEARGHEQQARNWLELHAVKLVEV